MKKYYKIQHQGFSIETWFDTTLALSTRIGIAMKYKDNEEKLKQYIKLADKIKKEKFSSKIRVVEVTEETVYES